MFTLKWWAIVGYFSFLLFVATSFNIYLKRKTGKWLFETFDVKRIPKRLRWIFVLGMIGAYITLAYLIIYLFYPQLIELTFPFSLLQNIVVETLGIALIVFGFILTLIAGFQLGLSARVWLPKQKTKLITTGVYGFCRNPIYVGVNLSFMGIFFLLPTLVLLIGFFSLLLINHFRILEEEKFLASVFGEEYKKYCQSVGRYWPKIGRKS